MNIESAPMSFMVGRKTSNFFMRMDPVIKEVAEKAAAGDRRSLAALVEMLLIDYCKKRGLLTENGQPKKPRRKGGKP
jgi:hypothetical protein